MKPQEVERFVMRYLEATDCQIIEKAPTHVIVKLSPRADKDLTNRPYYWGYVERTGVPPETMTYQFVFDPIALPPPQPPSAVGVAYVSTFVPYPAGSGRIPRDNIDYGSRRLEQLYDVTLLRGRFVRLFEMDESISGLPMNLKLKSRTNAKANHVTNSVRYSTWLGVTYKMEFACDMKRDELHSLGINLETGEIQEAFMDVILTRQFTPNLPAGFHVPPEQLPLVDAVTRLENHLEQRVRSYDHKWASEALERLAEEQMRIDSYYGELLETALDEHKDTIDQQYARRHSEIEWQYHPRIRVSVTNCGMFHLATT